MTLMNVLIDFCIVSVLMSVGYYLRRKIGILQKYHIPVALIAGTLGLLLGPQVLGSVSPVYLAYSDSLGQWTGVLAAIVFSCAFLGQKMEKVSGSALQTYFLAGTIHQAQVLVGLGAAFLIGLVIKELPIGFGLLPVLGFYGGHGLAIPAGKVFDDMGYMAGGADVAATFATIGVFCGVIGGIIIINRAAKMGKTTVRMDVGGMPIEELTGFYPPEKREDLGKAVSSSSAIDPLASQLSIVGIVIGVTYLIRKYLMMAVPFFSNVPLYAFCLLVSAVFTICTKNNAKVCNMIDRKTMVRISGTALEFMITANLALTNIKVFVTYGIPVVVMSILMVAVTYFFCFVIGDKMLYKDGKFETEIGVFGQCCAVLSSGLLLLKVVDPDYKTTAAENITSSSALGYTFQLQYTLIFMTLVTTAPLFVSVWSVGLFVVLFGLGMVFAKKAQKRGDI